VWSTVDVCPSKDRGRRRDMIDIEGVRIKVLWRSVDTAGYIKSDEEEEGRRWTMDVWQGMM